MPVSSPKTIECPACGKKYKVAPEQAGKKGRCVCGKVFHIPAAPDTGSIAAPAAVEAKCAQHGDVAATHTCSRCGKNLCQVCVFPQAGGSVLCPACAATPPALGAQVPGVGRPSPVVRPTSAALSTTCRVHPDVPATHLCTKCRSPVCDTCAFVFPGGVYLCPSCATTPQKGVTGKRKGRVVWAIVLAVWGTLALVALLAGAPMMPPSEGEVFGAIMGFLGFVPSMVGLGVGISCFERRLANPPIVWVAAIWNIVIVGVWILLIIVGIAMGG